MRRAVMGNAAAVEGKLERLRRGGVGALHVIADFDRTITSPDSDTSWGVLARAPFPAAFHAETSAMYKRFHPIEVDEKRSVAERREAMEDWWGQAHDLLLRQRVTRQTFRDLVATQGQNVFFRERTHELFAEMKRRGVPLLIFSAGLGDLIDAVVEKEEGWGAHAHVISNHLAFAEEGEGVAVGFRHRNITTFTKNEAVLTELHPVWEAEVRNRKLAIVLGDSIGDAHMAEGVPHDCVLTIGFLNRGQEASLSEYTAAFDVVLCEDNTMDYLIELLAQIPD